MTENVMTKNDLDMDIYISHLSGTNKIIIITSNGVNTNVFSLVHFFTLIQLHYFAITNLRAFLSPTDNPEPKS